MERISESKHFGFILDELSRDGDECCEKLGRESKETVPFRSLDNTSFFYLEVASGGPPCPHYFIYD